MEENVEKIEVGNLFTIVDEDDQDQQMEVLGLLPVEGNEYVAAAFVEELELDSEEDIDIYFFRIEEEGDLTFIESDAEFDKVSSAFEEAAAE